MRRMCQSPSRGGEYQQQEMRELSDKDTRFRPAFRRKEALVWCLREGTRGGGEQKKEVRGLRAKAAEFRTALGSKEAVVRWLREEVRAGGEQKGN